jgi:DNA-binding CsgD family transcriptional regulator
MVGEGRLMRMAGKLAHYIEQNVTLAGAEKKEEVLELFDSMGRLFPHWVIMTCPVMHPDMHYVSKNAPYVLGHDDIDLMNRSIEKYFDFVHEADQEDLHSCFAHAHEFLESLPSDLHHEYRLIFHYRFKKQNGQYIYVHDEKAVLNLPGSGNLYYVLLRDITAEKNFNGVKVEILKQEYTLSKIKEYKPSADRNMLTKREGELVTLIKQGLSTKEIAWYLKISHNTVRNIKSKLFEKYNVNNAIELLNITA